MKCAHCGFNNREGVKFCENCGESVGVKPEKFCPACGHKNRPGVKFCEECGAALGATAQAAAGPAAQPRQSAQPQVIVVEGAAKKKRVNLLWLVILLLLLLVTCCCLLLVLGRVATPAIAAPILDPVVEKIREVLPWGVLPEKIDIGPIEIELPKVPPPQPPTCEAWREALQNAELGTDTTCIKSTGKCYTDIVGLDPYLLENFYPNMYYEWEGYERSSWYCEKLDQVLRCHFWYVPDSDRVDFTLALNDCEEPLGWSDGWLEEELPQAPPPEPPASEPEVSSQTPKCCGSVQPEQPVYYRNPEPNGPLFLGFGAQCAEDWGFDANTCAVFDAFVGADRDQFWTHGECCPDPESPDRFLLCESNIQEAGQKKSATQIQLRYGECYWEFEFQSPFYAPKTESGCPSGAVMCAGSCCTGVCDCWEGVCSCSH
jgi:hypothetical protein